MATRPVAIALFSGAGGLSLGFERAGFDVRVATDLDKAVELTYRENNRGTAFIQGNIKDLHGEDLLDAAGLQRGDVDIVFGGPPCQGFSLANQQSRFLDNPNNHLFREFIRIVGELPPRWFLMENVVGLLRMHHGLIVQEIVEAFRSLDLDYDEVNVEVLRAVDHGVPQVRERVFFIGNREGTPFWYPNATHIRRYVTVREAIYDLPPLGDSFGEDESIYDDSRPISPYAKTLRNPHGILWNHRATKNNEDVRERYRYIKPGENWSSIPVELMKKWRSIPPEEIAKVSHSSLYKRLDPEEPSITVANFRKSMFIHPWEDRGLTVREAARLQSFPDYYRFLGSLGAQQQQVANAVPPLLGQAVASQILAAMEGRLPIKTTPTRRQPLVLAYASSLATEVCEECPS